MTQLEEEYNKDSAIGLAKLHALISNLKEERDSWLFNAKQLQAQVNRLEKQLSEATN